MFYKKEDGEKFTIPGGTKGVIFPSSPKGDQTIALVEMDGVYPEKGFSLNDYCTETLVLISGCLVVRVDGQEYELSREGDMVRILPGNKYSITGQGRVVVSIAPNWDSGQNHIISE